MLQSFYPDLYMDSAYGIDYEEYYRKGFRGIIFDIDNTLVEHGAPADERSIGLMERLKKTGFQIMLLSNNKEPRVKMFNDSVHVSYIFKAGKPAKRGYEEAMKKMGTDRETTLFVGDQLFTDGWNGSFYLFIRRNAEKKAENFWSTGKEDNIWKLMDIQGFAD